MGGFLYNVNESSVAHQIANLLNGNNKLKNTYTAANILHSRTAYVIELGGFSMRHNDGERKVIGCVGLEVLTNEITLIKHLSVHKNYQRQGIAKSLVLKALELCNTPYAQMRVRHDNLPSLHLAEDLGFVYVHHETVQDYYILVLGRQISGREQVHQIC